jgi:hypothetical protein
MNATWAALQRGVFGQPLSSPDGMEASVQATWRLPLGIAALVLFVGAVFAFTIYWYERPSANRPTKIVLASIRASLVLIVVLMLYGWNVQQHRTDRPDLVLVLDDSASMGILDSSDDPASFGELHRRLASLQLDKATRLNLAKALLLERNGDLLKSLQQRYHARLFLAGASARSVSDGDSDVTPMLIKLSAEQQASRLGNCLRDVLEAQRGRPTAGVIMFTDGVTTDGKALSEAAQFARRRSIPLFFVGLGSERPERDLKLADLLTDDVAFVGDMVHFDFKLHVEGYSGSAVVRLKRNGEADALAEENMIIDKAGAPQPLRLSHRADQAGEFEYVVEVVPREGEANVENNRLTRKIVIRDENVRVLLVQAYPSFEFRFLKQVLLRELNRDQSSDGKAAGFRTVLQEADLEYGESDKTAERTFPVSREELFQYDVLIFGDVNPSLLSPASMNNIYEFVTVRGGGLIFIAGPRYTPLAYRDTPIAHLLPMNLDTVTVPDVNATISDSFRPRLTPLGQASPMMQLADAATANERVWSQQLAPLRWMLSAPDLRPGVRVLAEHPTLRTDRGVALPVITLHFIGAGKVIFHATDETYRWRLRVGDVYFARYWVQTIRYLSRSKLLSGDRTMEMTTDREQYRHTDEIVLRARYLDDRLAPAADDGVMVVIEADTGQRRQVTLHRHAAGRGLFEGSAGSLPEGRYRAWIAAPMARSAPTLAQFTVVAPAGELAQVQLDAAELREAAKISLGRYYTSATAGKLLSDLPPGREVRIEALPARPIWNAPIVASVFVALIAVEWLIRKRAGLH